MPRSGPSVGIPSLLALAWLMSCGADVGGYHVAGQSDESAADASANGTGGGGSQSGGNQGAGGGGVGNGGLGNGGLHQTGGETSAGGTGAGGGGTGAGGTGTGGTGTGGNAAGGSGGSRVGPSDPRSVPLSPQSPSGITAAAYQPTTGQFFLLAPGTRQYFVVDTTGKVSAPIGLPGSGTVAPRAFAVSPTNVFFISGSTLYRQPVGDGAPFTIGLPGSPPVTTWSAGYAGGWLFVGNASGTSQALADAKMGLDAVSNFTFVSAVTTDGRGFAFRSMGTHADSVLQRIAPGDFGATTKPCAAGAFNSSNGVPVGVYANTVAWVVRPVGSSPYTLQVASTDGGCGAPRSATFGTSGNGSQAVGLIDDSHALVTPEAAPGSVTIDIVGVDESLTLTQLPVRTIGGSAFPVDFVVGVDAEAITHFAVLVTDDRPVLVSF
jgi:hypothetical protein